MVDTADPPLPGRSACSPVRRRFGLALVTLVPLVLGACGTTRIAPPVAGRGQPGGGLADDGTEIVLQAMAQVGRPYVWGGTSPDTGFDCSGLVVHVYQDALGIRLPRTSRALSKTGGPVRSRDLADGDLVFFNTMRRRNSHVGIYVGDNRFIHAPTSGARVRIERLTTRYWAQRYDGARRILGTAAAAAPGLRAA